MLNPTWKQKGWILIKKPPEDIIYYIGDHVTQSGYFCLIAAVEHCLKLGRYPRRQLMELVYKPAAQEMGISLERFNRAIGRATQDIWDRRSHKELDEIVGHHLGVDQKPSPRELILYLYLYLKEE